jgi:hypothetical protein
MEQTAMGSLYARAIAIAAGAFVLASLSPSAVSGTQKLSCVDARPEGELIQKHIVFEKDGVRSPDMFPLLKGWNPAAGTIDAVNNEQQITIKLSDWTALNVEQVQSNPAAQTARPQLVSDAPVDMTVDPTEIVIADGLIALTSQGCNGTPPDQGQENVFLGKITFTPNGWHLVGRYSTFARPSWNPGPSRKPG